MECAVVMKGITKKFGGKAVLEDVNLEIKKGEIFGLLGPSGAGKTTLIKIVTGQLKTEAGKAFINGKNSSELSGEDFRQFGIMMDNFGVYERLCCFDNLKVFADIYGLPKSSIGQALENMGLKNAEKTAAGKLSKGELSRLKLARAFMTDPSVLFLDEPTSALDPATADDIRRLIIRERDKGKTVFLTTHNMSEAEKLCDNIGLLSEGKIIERGSVGEICRRYNHQKRIKIHLTDGSDRDFSHDGSSAREICELLSEGKIETLHSTEPSLETVFTELTGKELSR